MYLCDMKKARKCRLRLMAKMYINSINIAKAPCVKDGDGLLLSRSV